MWFESSVAMFIVLIIMIICTMRFLQRIVKYKDIYKEMPFKKVLLSDIYDTLKTGDLIFYRSSITSFITDTIIPTTLYKHISMVIKIEDKLYSTESSEGSIYCRTKDSLKYLKNGVDTVPLLTKLKYFCGMIFISQLSKPLSEEREHNIIEYANKLYKLQYPSVISLYFDFVLNMKISKSLYCFQYIYLLLERIGLINKQSLNAIDLSSLITNIHQYNLNDNYQYSRIKQLVYDIT